MNSESNSPLLETPPTHHESPYNRQPDEHPVATGVGLVGGGAAGAAVGLTVGGPVGAVVGAMIGAVVGGVGGSAMAGSADHGEPAEGSYEPLVMLPTHDEIALKAYFLYEAGGKMDGHDFDDWIQAERELYDAAWELRDALAAERGHAERGAVIRR